MADDTPLDWQDKPSTATPITAAELERIEKQLVPIFSTKAARDNQITSPEKGQRCIVTGLGAEAGVEFVFDGVAWAAIPGQLIDFQEVSGAAAQTFTFDSIPDDFDNLRLVWRGKSNTNADIARSVVVTFNNDTGTNYDRKLVRNVTVNQDTTGATSVIIGELDGTNTTSDTAGDFEIFDYANSAVNRIVDGVGYATSPSVGRVVFYGGGRWINTAVAVTRIDLATGNAATKFDVGSKAWLYGF